MPEFRYTQAYVVCPRCDRRCWIELDRSDSMIRLYMGDPCPTDAECRASLLEHAHRTFNIKPKE